MTALSLILTTTTHSPGDPILGLSVIVSSRVSGALFGVFSSRRSGDSNISSMSSTSLERRLCSEGSAAEEWRWWREEESLCGDFSKDFPDFRRSQIVLQTSRRNKLMNLITWRIFLKGHGNEADFLGFLQKLVPHRSLTQPRAVPLLASNSRRYSKSKDDSPTQRVGE